MKKSKKFRFKKKLKNKGALRNAAPASAPVRSSRPRSARGDHETPLHRLAYTAAGAAGSALVGAFLAKEGWAPKTIAGALATLGAGLTWKGDSSTIKSLGSGAMGSAGGQLVLMLVDEHPSKKPSNAGTLPPGSLEHALERARARLAMTAGE